MARDPRRAAWTMSNSVWRRLRPVLPPRAAEAIRKPVKGAFRRFGWAPPAAPARTSKVVERWPAVAELYNGRIRAATLASLLGEGDGRTLLDLGAGPCVFAKIARDSGWSVTAVDARRDRLPDDLGTITFVQSDVRRFDPRGFDTILILGLLYHLELGEQRSLLASCARSRVILETQVHDPAQVPPAAQPWGYHMVEQDGLRGVIYPESRGGAVEANPMASVGNETSFWLTEEGLLEVFDECGYGSVEIVQPPHFSKYGQRKFYVLHP